MMRKNVFGMIAAALCAAAAHGDGPVTANWLPTAAGTYTLTDGANWDTGVAPTNGIDIANFAPGAIDGAQNIDLPATSAISSWYLGTVTGASNQTIRTPARHSNGTAIRYLTVANPNGFRGTWALKDAHTRLYLIPTNSLMPSLGHVSRRTSHRWRSPPQGREQQRSPAEQRPADQGRRPAHAGQDAHPHGQP